MISFSLGQEAGGDPGNTRNPPSLRATSFRKGGITKILPFLKGVPAGGEIFRRWIPASAGMTRVGRNDKVGSKNDNSGQE